LKATVRETAEVVAKHLHGYSSVADKKRVKDLTLLLKKTWKFLGASVGSFILICSSQYLCETAKITT